MTPKPKKKIEPSSVQTIRIYKEAQEAIDEVVGFGLTKISAINNLILVGKDHFWDSMLEKAAQKRKARAHKPQTDNILEHHKRNETQPQTQQSDKRHTDGTRDGDH